MERRITLGEVKNSLGKLLQIATMTIATHGIDGEPHAAAVYFACDEQLHFYFFSAAQSQHSRDIFHDERAAAEVHADCSHWEDIHGFQSRGVVEQVQTEVDWQHAWDYYAGKFPFVRQLEGIVSANEMYVFTPHWIRLVDNRKGFGYKQEWWRELARDDELLWRSSEEDNRSSGSVNG
jgi:uncharacterized protein YhbP (UPF0306 family)